MVAPAEGLAALHTLFSTSSAGSVLAAVPWLWERLEQQAQRAALPHLFSALVEPRQQQFQQRQHHQQQQVAAISPSGPSQAAILATVQAVLRSMLGADVAADQPLLAAGLDSLGAVELRNSLESELGVRLPGTLVFDYPTPAALAEYAASLQPLGSQRSAHTGSATAGEAVAPHVADSAQRAAVEVAAVVLEVLGAPVAEEQPFMAAGLDSLGAVELRNSLEARLGVQLPGTLVFDYPTPAALAAYLASRLQPAAAATAASLWDVSGALASHAAAAHLTAAAAPVALASFATRAPQVCERGACVGLATCCALLASASRCDRCCYPARTRGRFAGAWQLWMLPRRCRWRAGMWSGRP